MRQTILVLALLASACRSGGGTAEVRDESQTSMTAGHDRAEYVSGESVMEEAPPPEMAEATVAPEPMIEEPAPAPEPPQPLTFRGPDGNEVQVAEVVLRKARNGDQHLIFFREAVECSALHRLPTRRDETLIAMTEVEAPEAGPLPPSQWTVRVGARTRTARGEEGWVRITRAEDTVEGEVAIETEIQGGAVAMSGPFTARVCDLSQPEQAPQAQNEQPAQPDTASEAEGTSHTQ